MVLETGMHMGRGMFPGYNWLIQLVILVLLILIFWWLLKGQGFGYAKSKDTPFEIVQRRYAAGEITKKEYAQLKKDLKG